jgi:urease alpha subunit
MREARQYKVLEGMQRASTMDAFQGQENDVVVVIMGTAHPGSGLGLGCESKRLNFLLSRQKLSLIIVGDIKVATGKGRYRIEDEANGEVGIVLGKSFNAIYRELQTTGRVVEVVVRSGKNAQVSKSGDKGKRKGDSNGKDKARS